MITFDNDCEERAAGEIGQESDILFHSFIRGEIDLDEWNEREESIRED